MQMLVSAGNTFFGVCKAENRLVVPAIAESDGSDVAAAPTLKLESLGGRDGNFWTLRLQ